MNYPWPEFEELPYVWEEHFQAKGFGAERPLWRVLMEYRNLGYVGLSPFALAYITRHSPMSVLKRLHKEGYNTIETCYETQLPIVAADIYTSPDAEPFEDWFSDLKWGLDKELKEWATHKDIDDADSRKLANMLKKYGGRTWRRHCIMNFNPFKQDVVVLREDELLCLRQAFTVGRPGFLSPKLFAPVAKLPDPEAWNGY